MEFIETQMNSGTFRNYRVWYLMEVLEAQQSDMQNQTEIALVE